MIEKPAVDMTYENQHCEQYIPVDLFNQSALASPVSAVSSCSISDGVPT